MNCTFSKKKKNSSIFLQNFNKHTSLLFCSGFAFISYCQISCSQPPWMLFLLLKTVNCFNKNPHVAELALFCVKCAFVYTINSGLLTWIHITATSPTTGTYAKGANIYMYIYTMKYIVSICRPPTQKGIGGVGDTAKNCLWKQ